MRAFFLLAVSTIAISSSAQYYYKDIVGTKESADLIRTYQKSKVSRVVLTSFDAANQKDDDFYVEQQFSTANKSLKTVTRSTGGNPSTLVSYFDANGNVIRTVDSSNLVVSWTDYEYNAAGQLLKMVSNTSDSTKISGMNEVHIWQWENDHPVKMLRIKNGRDTIFVNFKLDDKGNVIEEQEIHKSMKTFPIFYYYDDKQRLTDIARFNPKANQVMAEYIFTYSDAGRIVQKYTIPSNNTDYTIWRYRYNGNGLKTKEAIFNKYDKKNPMGTVEYQYSFAQQ